MYRFAACRLVNIAVYCKCSWQPMCTSTEDTPSETVQVMSEAALRVQGRGSGFLVTCFVERDMCSNTRHRMQDSLAQLAQALEYDRSAARQSFAANEEELDIASWIVERLGPSL